MNKVVHVNNGNCPKCTELLNLFGAPPKDLMDFFTYVVGQHPDAHISYCGRGKADQELYFSRGTSKAHWGESPHNYNAAVDFFKLMQGGANFDKDFYKEIAGYLNKFPNIAWGGSWTSLKDYPHFELKEWKVLVKEGKLTLVGG